MTDHADTSTAVTTAQPEDFFQLLKPRVMSLVIFTAVTGLVVAAGRDRSVRRRPSPSCASPSGPGRRAR